MTGSGRVLRRRSASILSPLRYPGGKRRLVGFITEALRLNGLRPRVFVEPFAGGANVALQVLNDGLVERIVLGERDPLVAGFWRTVFKEHEWLVNQIEKIELSVDKWEWFRRYRPRSDRGNALKCLYLNRTSFSGILNRTAGPIGGRTQSSAHKLDCRFPIKTLVKRIRQAAALADRVQFVSRADWAETLHAVYAGGYRAEEVFVYFDPPFYNKAERLYNFYFDDTEHERLRDYLIALQSPFILSYDAAPPIIRLYEAGGIAFEHVEMLYSATKRGDLTSATELIVTNLPELPQARRLWMSSSEWREAKLSSDTGDDFASALLGLEEEELALDAVA